MTNIFSKIKNNYFPRAVIYLVQQFSDATKKSNDRMNDNLKVDLSNPNLTYFLTVWKLSNSNVFHDVCVQTRLGCDYANYITEWYNHSIPRYRTARGDNDLIVVLNFNKHSHVDLEASKLILLIFIYLRFRERI